MSKVRTIVLTISMVLASWVAMEYTPKPLYAATYRPEVTLAQLMPDRFGDWKSDNGLSEAVITPDVRASLARYYSDTLSRSYTNSRGERVMLALAFGADQGRAMQVHKPEVCYEGQGFKISSTEKATVAVGGKSIPVMRLVAKQDARVEPITYWIRSGDDVIRGWFEQNYSRVKAGLKGHLPDGLLFRVSTLDASSAEGYAVQDRFIQDLIPALSPKAKAMVLGSAY